MHAPVPLSHPSRILLVEDNPGDVRLVEEMLKSDGAVTAHQLHVAGSVEEAQEILRGRTIDVVLLDLSLPDSHGMETIDHIAKVREDLPVIVFTVSDDDETVQGALTHGCQDYLVKGSLDAELLRRTIAYAIERQATKVALTRALRDAEAANDAKARYLASISHKLRTPLNTILGLSELVLSGAIPDQERILGYVQDINTAGGDLRQVIDETLDIARIDAALKSDHQTYRQLVEMSPDFICIADQGRISLVNSAGAAMLGVYDPESLIGEPLTRFIPGDYHPLLEDDCEALVEEGTPAPMKLLRSSGERVDVMVSAVRFSAEKHETLLVARNISDLTKRTRELVHQNRRLASILETAVDAIVVTDGQGRVETYNPSAESLFGHSRAEVVGQPATLLLPDAEAQGLFLKRRDAAGMRTPSIETEGRDRTGRRFPAEVSVSESSTETGRMFTVIIRDVTERKTYQDRLQHLAMHDMLTGLPNRTRLQEHLTSVLAGIGGSGRLVGVTFLTLPGVKTVNETLGHEAGDELLQEAAQRIGWPLGDGDLLARFGDNEFIVVQSAATSVAQLETLIRDMVSVLSQPFDVVGRRVVLSGSFGTSIAPFDGETPEELIRQANTAMLTAQRAGENKSLFFDPKMNERAHRRMQLENELRLVAGEDGHFVVHYQPQMDIASGRIVGVEALLRWPHPSLGSIPPDEFIPLAEETGAVIPIGKWVLETACQDVRQLQRDGAVGLRLGINVAATQFTQPDFPEIVRGALDAAGLDPACLELEITETGLMADPEAGLAVLRDLKRLGVRISIDDFGTGYSSLAYLARFPVDALKIDKSFIFRIVEDPRIPGAVVPLAHSMGLSVIAEGVETEAHLAALRDLDCEEAQGYLISRPVPLADLVLGLDSVDA